MKLAVFIGGLLFGIGLAVSGMAQPEIVLSFLQLTDFGLVLVLLGAVLVTAITFRLAPRIRAKAINGANYQPPKKIMDKKTVLGAIIFGIGWGISGLCPGAALASVGIGNAPAIIGIIGMFAGAYLHGKLIG